MRPAFEEKRNRHLKDVRDLLQAAGADAVGALLVFLHLLEGQAERVAELLLTHAQHHAAHAHATPDVLVGRVGSLFRHSSEILECANRMHTYEQGMQLALWAHWRCD